MFYLRYSLDLRNPQAFPLHTMLRRGTRTQFLPCYVITCSGLRDSAPLFHTARQCCRFLTRDQSNGNPTPTPAAAQEAPSVGCPRSPESWDHSSHPNSFFKNTVIKNCLLLEGQQLCDSHIPSFLLIHEFKSQAEQMHH